MIDLQEWKEYKEWLDSSPYYEVRPTIEGFLDWKLSKEEEENENV